MATTTAVKKNPVDDINKVYDQLYSSGKGQYINAKNDALTSLTNESQSATNSYDAARRNNESNISKTREDYAGIYKGLDNDLRDGKANFYNQRDGAMYQNAKNVQAIRDYMSRQNLLSSGESVDAMLRNNSDYSNTMGGIRNNEQLFIRTNADNLSKAQLSERGEIAKYNNAIASALAERNRLIEDIKRREAGVYSSYDTNIRSLQEKTDADRAKAIFDYNEQLRQEAVKAEEARIAREWQAEQARIEREWQAEQNSLNRAASSSSSSSSGSVSVNDEVDYAVGDAVAQFNIAIENKDISAARNILGDLNSFQQMGILKPNADNEYIVAQNELTKLENQIFNDNQELKKKQGVKGSYGYRNGVAGWYY